MIDSLKAIFVEGDIAANVTIAEMALTGIECIMADSNVVLDLRSAVYMFTLVKSLVKHVDDPKAYGKYVGTWYLICVTRYGWVSSVKTTRFIEHDGDFYSTYNTHNSMSF